MIEGKLRRAPHFSEKSRWISPKGNRPQGDYRYPLHWLLCSFQGPQRGNGAALTDQGRMSSERPAALPVSQNSTAWPVAPRPAYEKSEISRGLARNGSLPGPVDMSSDRMRSEPTAGELKELRADRSPAFGALNEGSLERR
jgi:hypothetical protein